jgi:hypothetical protein
MYSCAMKFSDHVYHYEEIVVDVCFLMNTLYFDEIISFMCGSSRIAKPFGIIYMKEWIRLIEQESVMD